MWRKLGENFGYFQLYRQYLRLLLLFATSTVRIRTSNQQLRGKARDTWGGNEDFGAWKH